MLNEEEQEFLVGLMQQAEVIMDEPGWSWWWGALFDGDDDWVWEWVHCKWIRHDFKIPNSLFSLSRSCDLHELAPGGDPKPHELRLHAVHIGDHQRRPLDDHDVQ